MLAASPKLVKRAKLALMGSVLMRRAASSKIIGRYFGDLAFRGSVGIYQGMAVNFFYCAFCMVAAIRFASVWYLSMAVYYLALGALRTYLVLGYRRKDPTREYRCYRAVAWLLFLLTVPMGGMIVLMVQTNSGFSYLGYFIYLSALYTFYTMTVSVVNLVRFRKVGSSILSAAFHCRKWLQDSDAERKLIGDTSPIGKKRWCEYTRCSYLLPLTAINESLTNQDSPPDCLKMGARSFGSRLRYACLDVGSARCFRGGAAW